MMMTGSLYETHVYTKDLETAMAFYEQKLGMERAHYIEERRVAFYFFGDPKVKVQMLGVWEVSGEQWHRSHFAFGVTLEELKGSLQWLEERGIEPRESFGKAPTEPIVHTWVPAASVYFYDPDGNSLEFISVLPDEPRKSEQMPYLSEWERMHKR